MKNILLILTLFLLTGNLKAQIGIGTISPANSAILDVYSTDKALLLPRLTSEQRANISTPTNGLVIFCTNCGSNGEMQIYSGTAWKNVLGNNTSTSLANLVTTAASNISYTTATSGGNITYSETSVTAKGVCWSTSQNPTTANSKTTDGTGTGSFTSSITGLTANTKYYIRSYATNTAGTSYGSEVTLNSLPPIVASFATSTSSSITAYSATISSNITSDNGASVTTRGLCWSTTTGPTTSNSTLTNGTGTGAYNINITGLLPATTYYVRSYAINSVGTGYSSEISFTTAAIPTLTTTAISNITKFAANSGATINNIGSSSITANGVCWSTSATPTTANSKTTDAIGASTFSSSITSLNVNTTYYVRAYATNSFGTGYGDQLTFTTLPPEVATFATTTSSAITGYSALVSSSISSDNGASVTERGVCYSTTTNPTTSSSKQTNGTGIGAYDITITGLLASTTYYVRSYATNSVGTSYSAEISFTTGARSLPTLTTTAVSSIAGTTATSGGNITSSGNDLLTARGVCWSTSSNPTIANFKTTDGTTTGTYTSALTGLSANTTYYLRAYATNSVGTEYGNQVTFTTTPTLQGSLSFNGTSGYLGLSTGVSFGTGAFTVEGWIYVTSFSNTFGLLGPGSTGGNQLYFNSNTTIVSDKDGGGGSYTYTIGTPITANAWHYLIYNRNANGLTAVFIDGVRNTGTVQTDALNYTGTTTKIGYNYKGYFPGYMTNLRVNIGTANYNSNTTSYTNPTSELTSTAGTTKYLMLGASVTSDASSTQTITNNGSVSTSALKPF